MNNRQLQRHPFELIGVVIVQEKERQMIKKSKWRRMHGADNFRYIRMFVIIFCARYK